VLFEPFVSRHRWFNATRTLPGLPHRLIHMTNAAARKLLGLPPRKAFTEEDLQKAWRIAAKAAHPDAGGSDAAMAKINAARDLLQPIAQQQAMPAPARKHQPVDNEHPLAITPEGHLFGPGDLYVGTCHTIAAAIAFCGRAGWAYTLTKELTASQRMALAGGLADG